MEPSSMERVSSPVEMQTCLVCRLEGPKLTKPTCHQCNRFYSRYRKSPPVAVCKKNQKCEALGQLKKCSSCRFDKCQLVGMEEQKRPLRRPRTDDLAKDPLLKRHNWLDPITGDINYPLDYFQDDHLSPNWPDPMARFKQSSLSPDGSSKSSAWSSPSSDHSGAVSAPPPAPPQNFNETFKNHESYMEIVDMLKTGELDDNKVLTDKHLENFSVSPSDSLLEANDDIDIGNLDDYLHQNLDVDMLLGDVDFEELERDDYDDSDGRRAPEPFREQSEEPEELEDLQDLTLYDDQAPGPSEESDDVRIDHDYLPAPPLPFVPITDTDLISCPTPAQLRAIANAGKNYQSAFSCSMHVLEASITAMTRAATRQTEFGFLNTNLKLSLYSKGFMAIHLLDAVYASINVLVDAKYKNRTNYVTYDRLTMFDNEKVMDNCSFIIHEFKTKGSFMEYDYRFARTLLLFDHEDIKDREVLAVVRRTRMAWGRRGTPFENALDMLRETADVAIAHIIEEKECGHIHQKCSLVNEIFRNLAKANR